MSGIQGRSGLTRMLVTVVRLRGKRDDDERKMFQAAKFWAVTVAGGEVGRSIQRILSARKTSLLYHSTNHKVYTAVNHQGIAFPEYSVAET